MKKALRCGVLGLMLPLLTSCPYAVDPEPVSAYLPVLMSRRQLETSVKLTGPVAISQPGKLYRYGNYILINERYKGVHLIDNQDPGAPRNTAFIQMPGNVDFAVKRNVLYADNGPDLVAIDLGDGHSIRVAKRIQNAVPELLPPDNLPSPTAMAGAPKDAVIVGWELKSKAE